MIAKILAGIAAFILATIVTVVAHAAENFAWVQYVSGGVEARAVTSNSECPAIEIDGTRASMGPRATPGDNYPILVCAHPIPTDAKFATIDGRPLSLPKSRANRILIIGDTGCRIQGQRGQGCNILADWPFRLVADMAAYLRPDLVLHVGDYHYRETPCPSGNLGCSGSPYGDSWNVWREEFFSPAESLLNNAPWVFVRGNREECQLAGKGWARILSPYPDVSCSAPSRPFTVDLGGVTLVVIDNSTVDDSSPNESQLAMYKAAFASIANLAPTRPIWTAMHRPIWAISVPPGSAPGHSKTLAAAAKGSLPPNLQTIISGHLHTFQVTSYVEDLPIQIVSGTGGSQLSTPGVREVAGTSVGGMTVKAGVAKPDIFGFSVLERTPDDSANSWSITGYDIQTRVLARCKLQNRNVACE